MDIYTLIFHVSKYTYVYICIHTKYHRYNQQHHPCSIKYQKLDNTFIYYDILVDNSQQHILMTAHSTKRYSYIYIHIHGWIELLNTIRH
jgi:hypothetical protein